MGSYKVSDGFTFYFNVVNLFDAKAPLNPANYAATNYNPTYSYNGIIGRYFRIGGYFFPRGGMPIDVFWQSGRLPGSVWLPDQGVAPYRGRG